MTRLKKNRTRSPLALAFLVVVAASGTLALNAGPASAIQLSKHSFASSFDGAGSTYGAFGPSVSSVAVDEANGYVYVISNRPGVPVDKFDAAGNPVPFTAPELASATSITHSGEVGSEGANVTVDNSGTATQGRIYVTDATNEDNFVYAYEPSGRPVGGNFPLSMTSYDTAVEPDSADLWVVPGYGVIPKKYTSAGVFTGMTIDTSLLDPEATGVSSTHGVGVDSKGNVYFEERGAAAGILKYNALGQLQYRLDPVNKFAIDQTSDNLYTFNELGELIIYSSTGSELAQVGSFGAGDVAVNGSSGKIYVVGNAKVSILNPGATITLPDVTTGGGSDFQPTSVTVNGKVDPDGVATNGCRFEWGVGKSYGHTVPCNEGNVLSGSGEQEVSAGISGVSKGVTYHYRLSVTNSDGTVKGRDETFAPSAAPTAEGQFVTDVHSDSALIHATINPGGAETTYRVEYGSEDCAVSSCESTGSASAGRGIKPRNESFQITGLQAGSTYHYRVVATNQSGSTFGADLTFTTFPFIAVLEDRCPNAHVRQQTGAALLLDCRAFELASSANAGGYDVESDLVVGQEPYEGHPRVGSPSKLLYAIHDGAIPGVGNPANRGRDPYIATRGESGWTTSYVGIPSDNPFASGPFASELLEAAPGLDAFAFGGPDICAPCFDDGSSNVPLRLPDGSLIKGIAGSQDPGPAEAAGHVAKYFSDDGRHFVFGTTTQVEPAGNDGSVSIYERDLVTGTTQVVSTLPDGTTMSGTGIGELDVSADGSRILVAQRVSTDSAGNDYWHPYMHIGTSAESVDLAPGSTSGVLHGGMTFDGSKVFFTTTDSLTAEDTDESADIYRADVSAEGDLALDLISVGAGAGDTDSCTPVQDWNTVAPGPNCNAVALAGGAGVASGDGTIYFLSPEKLDGPSSGVEDQPNLYVVRPGSPPHFVATIDSSIGKPPPPRGTHSLLSSNFTGTSLNSPGKMAVDQVSGDLYVIESGAEKVARFTSSGAPQSFVEGPGAGTNKIPGLNLASQEERAIGVDSSGSSPLSGTLYVTNGAHSIKVFSTSGAELGEITGSGTAFGQFQEICGLAVDNSNGAVYFGDYAGYIWRYLPTGSAPISDADYAVTGIRTESMSPCQVGSDAAGHVYAKQYAAGVLQEFDASMFDTNPPPVAGKLLTEGAISFMTDPGTNELYVGEDSKITVFDQSGEQVETIGAGQVSNTRGVAINATTKHVYNAGASTIAEFGYVPGSSQLIDNPAVLHAVNQAETHSFGDFQVTPDGGFAAFASGQSLTGYDNGLHSEVFLYDPSDQELECASCNPTNAKAAGDATLAANGLSLTDDGRVFFQTTDAIAPRDLNGKRDAYEFAAGTVQLISTGASPFNSNLLGVSADGVDAYFFTRDTLVPGDQNGALVKVYDARAYGGFAFIRPPVPCKASDECHGPGTEAPGPAPIRTLKGAHGNRASQKKAACKRRRVKRHGRCVKPRRQKKSGKGPRTIHRHG